MPKIDIARTELVWPGKYDDDGNLVPPRRVSLPFQVIERVNETRATRAQHAGHVGTLFDYWQADEQAAADAGDGWRNKLIWGDNLYVMGSLLEHFAGKVDLIYIDPPFATGSDFSFTTQVGEDEDARIGKEQSIIEEKAYRDTWGQGLPSYLEMIHQRLSLIYDLLAADGSLYIHCDTRVNAHLRLVMDEIFGGKAFVNQVTWRRTGAHNDPGRYGMISDTILFYAKQQEAYCWNQPYSERSDEAVEASFCYAEQPDGRFVRIRKGQPIPSALPKRIIGVV
jgi:adenine-specific DNA-methyltransferase